MISRNVIDRDCHLLGSVQATMRTTLAWVLCSVWRGLLGSIIARERTGDERSSMVAVAARTRPNWADVYIRNRRFTGFRQWT